MKTWTLLAGNLKNADLTGRRLAQRGGTSVRRKLSLMFQFYDDIPVMTLKQGLAFGFIGYFKKCEEMN